MRKKYNNRLIYLADIGTKSARIWFLENGEMQMDWHLTLSAANGAGACGILKRSNKFD